MTRRSFSSNLGSVRIALDGCEPHNHRLATVCGEAIPVGQNDHVHEVCFCTDFYEDHYHEFTGRTGGMIPSVEEVTAEIEKLAAAL